MKKIIYLIFLLSQFCISAWSASAFVIKDIQIYGLQRTSPATVENYLSLKRGQLLRPGKTSTILRDLYQTGFFDHITLSRRGNILIIHVIERPTIGQLKISGNSIIPTDKLTKVMITLGIAEGQVYNPEVLGKIKQSLLNQYYQLGRYNARVDVTTQPMSRNRIFVHINISEGLVAKIKRISIIGNHEIDEATLVKQLGITTSGLFTFFTQKDCYSEMKLEESLERLRNYYLDHGYLRVEIKSSQAEVTPDRKSVYINIVVEENAPFLIKEYKVTGDFSVPKEEIINRITIQPGEIFSRQKIIDSEKAITYYLGEQGYVMSSISLRPIIHNKTNDVTLIFDVNAGKRIYVRHITFSNNTKTNDVVLRREVRQLEAAPVSTPRLEESKHRLQMLPYLGNIDMSINPVETVDDQVDVNFRVEEQNAAQISAKIGYAQSYGVLIGGGLNHKNFLGTGNTLGINLNRSRYAQNYSIDYTNPYYTEDGISRTITASISSTDPGALAKVNSGYSTNEYNFGVIYGIPLGQEPGVYSRFFAGLSYQNILIYLNHRSPQRVSNQVRSFINQHGRRYYEADLKLGYTRDSRDRAIFPTRGTFQTLFLDAFAPLAHRSLSFYMLSYHGKWYLPITNQFILLGRTDLGYGNALNGAKNFPFFKNYFAGGIDSVRGYLTYNLGPRDSNNQAYGGNVLVDASIALIFPNYISDNLRTSVYIDGGNVYSSLNNRNFGGQSTNAGPPRYSVGIEVDWLTPLGPIQLSLAKAILNQQHSRLEPFQFALGANF